MLGDGEREFSADSFKSVSAAGDAMSAEDRTWKILGGSAVGGIVGYLQQGVIDGCIGAERISFDSKMIPASVVTDIPATEESSSFFAGAIAGYFHYIQDTPSASGKIMNCQFTDTMPIAFAMAKNNDGQIDNVENVRQVAADMLRRDKSIKIEISPDNHNFS